MEFEIKKGVLTWVSRDTKEFVIPETVKVIGEHAFAKNPYLKRVIIPTTVTKIDSRAFENCTALEEIEIPSSVLRIEGWVFHGCSALKRVHLSRGLTYVGGCVFSECASLEEIEIPDTVNVIWNTFGGAYALKRISLPEGIKFIIDGTFAGCSSLEEFVLPKGPDSIGRYAFSGCTKLRRVTISEGVQKIWHEAFKNCRALEEVILPKSLKEMGEDVFSYYVHVTDHEDYDCYNGNESFYVPVIAYPVKISKVTISELKRPSALLSGFLRYPELYSSPVAADYFAYLVEYRAHYIEELASLDCEKFAIILKKAKPTREDLLLLIETVKESGNEALVTLFNQE